MSLGFIAEERQAIFMSSSSSERVSSFSGDTADAWEMLGCVDGAVHLGGLLLYMGK